MTNPTAGGGAEGYRPDPRLKGIYRQADELDDEALQTLCPSFSELAAVETRYTQKMLIGKGALKAIYRCFDERTQRFVALARPRAEHGADCYDDFVHEAWLVCALRHPNIIKVHDAGVDTEGRPYFTMDLKGGSTLADVVNQGTALRPLLAIFLKICDAVAYAHAEGIIHRDLKPENIQCARFGEVLVCDWGLGKFVHESGRDVAGRDEVVGGAGGGVATASGRLIEVRHMTAHGDIKGSPGFMAPEQIQPGGVCDDRSDGFALGCLLHFILTGEAPFTGTREEILAQTVEPSRKSPRRAYPGKRIPKSLDAVVLKAIAADPRDRYESVTGLQTDVSSFLAGHGTTAERPGVLRRAGLFVKRNKTPVSIAAAALGVLTLSGFLFLAHAERKEREARIERARSQLLSTEFDALSAEYEELMNQSEETREEWAEKLTISAIRKKSASVFTRPKVPFRDVRALIAKALELDPESAEARFQYFSNCCIMLDFEEAMKHPVDPQHRMAGYMNYVAAIPGFDYS
ncbi:MAG: serine/threonine-protein kinase, partial [Verrucomicrobiales bacterium]